MNRTLFRRALLVVVAGVVLGLAVVGWGWRMWTGPGPRPDGRPEGATDLVRIPPGMTLKAAADTLQVKGFLDRPDVLWIGARLTGRDRSLRAGLYELRFGSSPRDLLDDLTSGLTVQVRFTIPEGLEAGETAVIVGRAMGFTPVAFLAAADSLARLMVVSRNWLADPAAAAVLDTALVGESTRHGKTFHWSEGLLAPDTYLFAEGAGPVEVAAHLISVQAERVRSVLASADGPWTVTMSPYELVTLASIVEAEARRADERDRIAAVYTNRLVGRQRLEADPTVAFFLGKKGKRLFFRDLKTPSAYNTYLRAGLPLGPIGSPGMACIEAARNPTEGFGALYFVSDGADGHVFSNTAAEHEEAVRRFREIRGQDRRGSD